MRRTGKHSGILEREAKALQDAEEVWHRATRLLWSEEGRGDPIQLRTLLRHAGRVDDRLVEVVWTHHPRVIHSLRRNPRLDAECHERLLLLAEESILLFSSAGEEARERAIDACFLLKWGYRKRLRHAASPVTEQLFALLESLGVAGPSLPGRFVERLGWVLPSTLLEIREMDPLQLERLALLASPYLSQASAPRLARHPRADLRTWKVLARAAGTRQGVLRALVSLPEARRSPHLRPSLVRTLRRSLGRRSPEEEKEATEGLALLCQDARGDLPRLFTLLARHSPSAAEVLLRRRLIPLASLPRESLRPLLESSSPLCRLTAISALGEMASGGAIQPAASSSVAYRSTVAAGRVASLSRSRRRPRRGLSNTAIQR